MPVDTTCPKEILKKHVALIHVSGQPTLLQRKAANAMHLHAYNELGDTGPEWHTISIRELAEQIGYDSRDWKTMHDALLGLVDIRISFDLTGEGGGRIQGRMGYMSQVIIKHNSGCCRYSYPPIMRAWLHRPKLYARVNLSVQRAFSSRYTLALYENCVRYTDNNTGLLARQYQRGFDQAPPAVTGWKSLQWWREVMGVKGERYPQFKELNRRILKPAIQEVNTFSNIVVEMHIRRKNRRISELLFVIRRNRQPSLFAPEDFLPSKEEHGREPTPPTTIASLPPTPVGKAVVKHQRNLPLPQIPPSTARENTVPEQELCKRMYSYGIARHKHAELIALELIDPGRIDRNLCQMINILKSDPDAIKSPGAWAVEAIRQDYSATVKPDVLREIEADKERAQAVARRTRQKAKAEKQRAQQQHTAEIQEEHRLRTAGIAMFERWPKKDQVRFDTAVEADLTSQIDPETGKSILSTTGAVRDIQIRAERAHRLIEIVRKSG